MLVEITADAINTDFDAAVEHVELAAHVVGAAFDLTHIEEPLIVGDFDGRAAVRREVFSREVTARLGADAKLVWLTGELDWA